MSGHLRRLAARCPWWTLLTACALLLGALALRAPESPLVHAGTGAAGPLPAER